MASTGLKDYQIDDNRYLLKANQEQIRKRIPSYPQVLWLREVVRPWNPGYHVGCRVETFVRPVPDSLEVRASGHVRFEAEGDPRLDVNPETGLVDVAVMVDMDPLCVSMGADWYGSSARCLWNPVESAQETGALKTGSSELARLSFAFRSWDDELRQRLGVEGAGKDIPYDKIVESLSPWELCRIAPFFFEGEGEAKAFLSNLIERKMSLFQGFEEMIDLPQMTQTRKSRGETLAQGLVSYINRGTLLRVSGVYSQSSRPSSSEALEAFATGALDPGANFRRASVIYASSLQTDFAMEKSYSELPPPRYKIEVKEPSLMIESSSAVEP